MTILHNPQIAEVIETGCAFKSDVIISKNETKEIEEKKKKEISEQLQHITTSHRLVNLIYFTYILPSLRGVWVLQHKCPLHEKQPIEFFELSF